MKDYQTKQIKDAQKLAAKGIKEAKTASEKYSKESVSRLAFQVGYLEGIINQIKAALDDVV